MPGGEQDFGAQSLGYLLFSLRMDFARKKLLLPRSLKAGGRFNQLGSEGHDNNTAAGGY